jgi:hypothetical protein
MRKLIASKLLGAAKKVAKKIDKKVVDSLAARANKKAGVAGTTAKRSAAARKGNKAAQAQVKKASKLFPKNKQARANAVKKAKARAGASAARLKRREAARKAGLANQRSAKKTAKTIYKGTAAGAGATAVGGGAAAVGVGSKPKTPTKPKTPAKPKAKGKAFNVAGLRSAYNKAKTPSAPEPKAPLGPKNKTNAKKKPVKKAVKMANVKTAKSRTGVSGKTQVPVGSSVIRNRDGSIKKINKPTANKKQSKFKKGKKVK